MNVVESRLFMCAFPSFMMELQDVVTFYHTVFFDVFDGDRDRWYWPRVSGSCLIGASNVPYKRRLVPIVHSVHLPTYLCQYILIA